MHRLLSVFLLLSLTSLTASAESFPLRENGSISVWAVVGTFPFDTPNDGPGFYYDFLETDGGETKTVPSVGDRVPTEDGAGVGWQASHSSPSGELDLREILGASHSTAGVAYAFCQLRAEREQTVTLRIRSNDGVRAWLNQDLIHDHRAARTLDAGEDIVPALLQKGINRLLVKVDQRGGAWGLVLSMAGKDGKPVRGITTSVPGASQMTGKVLSAEFQVMPLIVKAAEGKHQILVANINSGGLEDVTCRVTSAAWPEAITVRKDRIPPGKHRFEVQIPVLERDTTMDVTLGSSTDRKEYTDISVPTMRDWTVYLVQHVHTDIGYTRPQTEILPEHLRYIDYALDFCDLTDDYPDDARFRWTCEISWAVREYLNRRPPEQIERLKRRVREGRIELAGMFLNMAEIATESSLAASLQPVRQIQEQVGCQVRTTLQNDVNGAAWCLPDYFQDAGIRYLIMGINRTRSILPFDKPTAFWWESPAGKRTLALRADHYHTGNFWKVHDGKLDTFREGLLDYLRSLEDRDYPFDRVSVQYSGYHTDNSPPALIECDLVREWNENYAWPKLRMATAQEFLEYIETNHADTLPVHREAWPDWWTDGFGSAARETAESRRTHSAMQSNNTLLAMASSLGADIPAETMNRVRATQEALLFYDEHTYGAAESISDPMAENSMVQWGEKASYVWEAVKGAGMLHEEAMGLMQGYIPRADVPTIAVLNTLNWERDGLVEVFIDHEILPVGGQYHIVDNISGKEVPAQPIRSRSEGTYWALWVSGLPPLGYKLCRIELEDAPPRPEPQAETGTSVLENDYYRITFDPSTGSITGLRDKELDRELIDADCQWSFGELIHEKLSDRSEMTPDAFQRSGAANVKLQTGTSGAIWKSVGFSAELVGCSAVHGEIRLYETEKRLEFLYSIRKEPIHDAEAIYAAFPFAWPEGRIVYEAQGGAVTPGKNQIPGSASDWQTAQSYISVRGRGGQIIFGSDAAPLVQFGDINVGKWQQLATVERPHVYSWILNNYWFTNFRATQEGELKWSYYLTSTEDTSNAAATRFGWESRIPLVPRVLPPGKTATREPNLSRSIINVGSPNILLVEARPAYYSDGIILHLREVNGEQAAIDLSSQPIVSGVRGGDVVNVLEATLAEDVKSLSFAPYEVKFVRVVPSP